MKRYQLTPDAARDIEQIAAYLAIDSLQAAHRFAARCDETFAWLADAPHAGRGWRSHSPRTRGIRLWSVAGFPNHLVFYRPVRTGILVLHVLSGARDLDRHLDSP